jgi:hypothetical protein
MFIEPRMREAGSRNVLHLLLPLDSRALLVKTHSLKFEP